MGRLRDYFWRSSFFPRKLSITREGKVVILVSIGLGFAAVNTGNNLIYLIFGLSLALIVISGILSEANLRNLKCLPLTSLRVGARRVTPIVLTVECHRKRFPAFSIEAWPFFDDPGLTVDPARFLELRPGRPGAAACSLTFAHRGEFPLRGMVLSTEFPFSFFRKSVVVPTPAAVLVHPVVYSVEPDLVPLAGRGEDEHRPVAGRGMEFFGVRDYREGDNPRHVLHRRSASRPNPVVREFEEQGSRRLNLVLLNATSGGSDRADAVEQAVERVASLAVHYLDQGEQVALITGSGSISSGTGPDQVERVMDFLATVPVLLTDEPGLRALSRRLRLQIDDGRVIWVDGENASGGARS